MKVGTVIRIPLITHKTILMKLPSFADATKGASAPHGDDPARKRKAEAAAGPVEARTR